MINNNHNQCLLEGVKHNYDACASCTLKEAKDYYGDGGTDMYKYIGSSHVYFINNVKNESDKLYHFFVINKI